MSSNIQLRKGQKYIYKVEILQIFKPQSYQERQDKAERVRPDRPTLVELGWFDTPAAARNYGSYRTGRSAWYHSVGKPKTEYVKVDDPSVRWGYKYEKRDVPQPHEPDQDYRVYRVPVSLEMGEEVLLPALKRLYEVED